MPARKGESKADAGQFQRPKEVTPAKRKRGKRPNLAAVEPLYHTYDQPKPADAYFDEAAAKRAVRWIETKLRHYKGQWAGQPLYLVEWEKRIVRELFGWKRADGLRLYRTCYVEAPRKSGKSTLASAIALYLAHGDGEAAPEIFFAAYDKDQAKICYDNARFMTEASPELHDATVIYNSKKEMLLRHNPGGFLKCLSADAAKQYGLNIHGLIFDELMTQKTRDMWNALTTSEGSRRQPLIFCITTAGWDQQSICFEQHSLVRQIMEGTAADPSFLGVVYGAPSDADWTDPEVWKSANPSLGETIQLDYYERKATRAQAMPTEQNAFRTLLLSQWVGQAERFLDLQAWDRCAEQTAEPAQQLAFGGLDLSATTDMTAFVMVAERAGKLDVYPHIFIPEANLLERERRDRAPYGVWAEQGLITLTPGAVVDYGYVIQTILEAAGHFELRDVGYDRWNSSQLVKELEDEGIEMVKIGQGFAGVSSPTKELARMTLEGKLRHGNHPVLRWCANALAVQTDHAGNVKPAKDRSAQRIDPIVALILALDGWMRRGRAVKTRSVYETRGLVAA